MPIGDEQWVQEQLAAIQAQRPPLMPTGSPDDGTSPSWTGLLGEVLGGGQAPGYRLRGREADTAGHRALLNFGINMLLASGPQRVKPDLLSAAATGLQGAQQSLDVDQRKSAAVAGQQYQLQSEAQKARLDQLKTALPLLKFQQEERERQRIQNIPLPGVTPMPGQGAAVPAIRPFVAQNLPEGVTPALDQVVRTVIGEAEGEEPRGQQAVAAVIRNRMAGGRSASDVIFQPGAFEPWANPARRKRMEDLSPSDPLYQRVLATVRPVMEGQAPDPTGGATHFYSPTAQRALGRETPAWGTGTPKAEIGRHRFYSPDAPVAASPGSPRPAAATVPPVDVAPTGRQVAGPAGVVTPGAAVPASAEVPGNVNAIIQGMTGAGADPTTLAPGPGGAPPGVAIAQAGRPAQTPPVAAPDEDFETFRRRNPTQMSPEQQAELAGFATAKQKALYAFQVAGTAAEKAKAAQDYAQIEINEGKARREIGQSNDTRLFDIWKADRARRDKLDEDKRKHEQELTMETLRASNKRQENVDTAVTGAASERVKDLQGRAGVAQRMIRNVQALEALAPSMGDPNALVASNPQLRDWLITLNLPGLAGATMGELRTSQVWDRLVTSFGADVRVPGSGSTSDKEGEWMMSQFGGPEQTVEDRMTQLAILRKLSENRIADHTDAADMFQSQNGKLSGLDKKIAERSKLFDRPPAWKAEDGSNLKTQGRYMMRHPRGEPYAAYNANGELRYYRNEMVTDPNTGKSRLEPRPLLGGSMVAE